MTLTCIMVTKHRKWYIGFHGSSEGHEMLKRNDKYHLIADDVPIPKMYFLSKSVDGLFKKLHFCV